MQIEAIPCIAIEGNHDWIHRRNHISWMEALSEMGYIRLLRPARTEDGGYRFDPFDEETALLCDKPSWLGWRVNCEMAVSG